MSNGEVDNSTALGWREIASRLRTAIENNDFGVGGQIPTEVELMQKLGATRYSVRRALGALQQSGLIRIEQGRGTFVHDAYLVSYQIARRARFTDVLVANNITPGQEILTIEIVEADDEIRDFLKLPRGSFAMFMELLGYANGQIVKHDRNYFPLPRFEGFEKALRASPSVTEALAIVGVSDYHRVSTSIIGRLPTAAEARLLRQLPSQPIFECQRLDADESNDPIIYGTTVFSCERVRLTV